MAIYTSSTDLWVDIADVTRLLYNFVPKKGYTKL